MANRGWQGESAENSSSVRGNSMSYSQPRTFGMGKGAASGAAPNPGNSYPQDQPSGQWQEVQHAGASQQIPPQYASQPMQPQIQYVPVQYVTADQPQKKKRGAGFWIAIVIALIAIVIAGILAFQMFGGGKPLRDPNQAAGQLEGKTPEEIQAELDRVVEEGMFNISIASVVEFADGASEGELRIENVPGNRYLMKVVITEDASGDVIYESGVIEPNHHVQRAKLAKDLDAGTYGCTAAFSALDPDTEEEIGQAAAKMTINVLG